MGNPIKSEGDNGEAVSSGVKSGSEVAPGNLNDGGEQASAMETTPDTADKFGEVEIDLQKKLRKRNKKRPGGKRGLVSIIIWNCKKYQVKYV